MPPWTGRIVADRDGGHPSMLHDRTRDPDGAGEDGHDEETMLR
jgi:hypothetical protein